MTASAADRTHVRAIELSCECATIAHELERLVAADEELIQRECQIHGLVRSRLGQLKAEQRELSGLLDGARA